MTHKIWSIRGSGATCNAKYFFIRKSLAKFELPNMISTCIGKGLFMEKMGEVHHLSKKGKMKSPYLYDKFQRVIHNKEIFYFISVSY
jgi:hypothetical protein